jgi:hypothetical protein
LEGYVGSQGYDRDVLELLGEVCWRMGDVPAAGRFWFFCPADTDAKREAIHAFVCDAGVDRRSIASRLPRRLRNARRHQYSIDVQKRLRALGVGTNVLPPRVRRPRWDAEPTPRRRAATKEYLAFSVLTLVGLFFAYCFSLGLAQLFSL